MKKKLKIELTFWYIQLLRIFGFKRYTYKFIPRLAKITKPEFESFDVYIGRENRDLNLPGSIWGNPFYLKRESDRPDNLAKHMEYLVNNPELLKQLKTLSGKILGCYCFSSATCKGKRCHGHNIIQLYKEKILGIKSISIYEN